jgi:hypothetical protein
MYTLALGTLTTRLGTYQGPSTAHQAIEEAKVAGLNIKSNITNNKKEEGIPEGYQQGYHQTTQRRD